MRHLLPLLLTCVVLATGSRCRGNGTATLARRKRSLTFPKGSAFVLTAAVLKPIMLKKPANWNFDLEFDVTWPIPSGLQSRGSGLRAHRRHRRELYSNLELALDRSWSGKQLYDAASNANTQILRFQLEFLKSAYSNSDLSQGLPGTRCILRAICEAKLVLNPPGVSLVEDLLGVVFSYPAAEDDSYDAYDHSYSRKENCETVYACPFSLGALLNYHRHLL